MPVIRPLHVGVLLLAAIEILQGAKTDISSTAVLIIAIVAALLVVLDLLAPYARQRT